MVYLVVTMLSSKRAVVIPCESYEDAVDLIKEICLGEECVFWEEDYAEIYFENDIVTCRIGESV